MLLCAAASGGFWDAVDEAREVLSVVTFASTFKKTAHPRQDGVPYAARCNFDVPNGVAALANGDLCIADAVAVHIVSADGKGRRTKMLPFSNISWGNTRGVLVHEDHIFVSVFHYPDSFICKLRVSDLEMVCRTESTEHWSSRPVFAGLAAIGDILFACDAGGRRVIPFHIDNLTRATSFGFGHDRFINLNFDIAAYGDEVYVLSDAHYQIVVYSGSGSHERLPRRVIGKRGTAPGEFGRMGGILIARDHLFVSEGCCVQVLSLDGTPRQVLVVPGSDDLGHLACHGEYVHVTDRGKGRVHVLRFRP